jgi:hypothetical protein
MEAGECMLLLVQWYLIVESARFLWFGVVLSMRTAPRALRFMHNGQV